MGNTDIFVQLRKNELAEIRIAEGKGGKGGNVGKLSNERCNMGVRGDIERSLGGSYGQGNKFGFL